ncbi:MAG: DUF4199 domain-containing protein [Bacteroidota bacterium]|nr:DUF4199 domain-containing protein [Bacteroidota bacterium]
MSTVVKWGLITGMIYIAQSLVSNLLGIQQQGMGSGIGVLMLILITGITFYTIFLAIKEQRDENQNGYLTTAEGFKMGLKIGFIAGLLAGLFTLIYMKFIDPEMTNRMMEAAEEQWDKQGMDDDQREMARKWGGMFMSPLLLAAIAVIWTSVMGMLKGVIAGSILKKDPPPVVPMA